jgi:branched-chain amino acid transport system substrate-binding protein
VTTPVASKRAAETLKAREQLSSSGGGSTFAGTEPKPGAQDAVASLRDASERNVRGVTDNEIRLGISAPFTGSAKELGNQMKLGIETAFGPINEAGGIHGRQAKLIAADDGYEPSRTAETMNELYDKQQVFGFIGNVGTPTAVVAVPYALERKALFFGAFTGAGLLRRDPPDRYVFNYRASYAEETYAVVRYLVKLRGLKPDQIAVFSQQDAYGDSGFAGVAKAVRALTRGDEHAILRLDYKRNTVDVDDAVARLRAHKKPVKAVVMVSTYRAAAKFIEKTRDLYPAMIYTNVSFVGSTALADELMLLGPRYAKGVIVTQVVPAVDSYASTVLKYKTALAKHFPGVAPDFVSLEGYVVGNLLQEGMKRAGRQLDTEKLVEALETVRDFDMGLGAPVSFGPTEHQGSHKVWGTQLNENGRYEAIDLE